MAGACAVVWFSPPEVEATGVAGGLEIALPELGAP